MDLNIQTLRIFCKVVEEESFSGAARALKITQPTVSQQISRVEEYLGTRAFERVGKKIHLTSVGQDFFTFARDLVEKADHFAAELKDQNSQPNGLVRYAMPESCQWTPHYRKIMSKIMDFPGIRFEIEILPNSEITRLLLEGKIDFGFITGERLAPELRFEKFADEHYSLVAADQKFFEALKQKKFNEFRLISYPGWELFASAWFKSAGIDTKSSKAILPVVKVGTLAGAIHAAQEGAGAAIIPTHCVLSEIEDGRLVIYDKTKTKSATHPIHLVRRGGEKLSKRAELVLEMLRAAKKGLL